MNQDLTIEDEYKEKYLKYKIKYIRLKQIEANDFNKNSTEDEFKRKYLKYKRKYIELKQIGAKSVKEFYIINDRCCRYQSIVYLLTTSSKAKNYKTAIEHKNKIDKKSYMTVNNKFKVVPAFGKDSFIHNTIEPESVEYEDDDGTMKVASDINTIKEVLQEKAIEIENKVHDAFLEWYNNNKKKKNMNTVLVHGTTDGSVNYFRIFKLSKTKQKTKTRRR